MDNPSRQRKLVPAPLLVLLCLAVGGILQHFYPRRLSSEFGLFPALVAGLLGMASLLVGIAGLREFHRHDTPSSPFAPTTALVTSGIFQHTRNPMYLGFALLSAGLALGVNSLWLLLAAVALAILLQYVVIRPEERFLAARFGASYQAYCRRTRRWF